MARAVLWAAPVLAPPYACAPQPGYAPAPNAGAEASWPFEGEDLALFVEAGADGVLRAEAAHGEGDAASLWLRGVTLVREAPGDAGGGLRLAAPAAALELRAGTLATVGEVRGELTLPQKPPPPRPAASAPPAPPPPAPPAPPPR